MIEPSVSDSPSENKVVGRIVDFFFFFKHPAEASSAILQFWCQDWLCFASSSAHLLRTDPDPEQLCVELFLSLWLEEAGPYRELFQMI